MGALVRSVICTPTRTWHASTGVPHCACICICICIPPAYETRQLEIICFRSASWCVAGSVIWSIDAYGGNDSNFNHILQPWNGARVGGCCVIIVQPNPLP